MTSVHHLRSALAEAAPTRALPVGSRLHGGQYEVLGALSQSAFGINYYAVDHRHDRPVVVKEYLPTMLALRGAQATLVTASDEAAFQAGLRSFLHEARLLATCVQPGLIHVQRSWREHGTAYMAMPSHEAPTLRRVIGARGGPPDEAELRTWLMPILDALAALHAADCVHGDITPDSILITEAGALLLGFGGGRHAVAQALGTPGEALKPGYAAPEQYAPDPSRVQGPWTDLYSLAAVLRASMTGRAPLAALGAHAVERRARDRLPPLRELVAGRYSRALVRAVDAALERSPTRRPPDVAAFRALLKRRAGSRRRTAPASQGPGHRLGRTMIAAGAICVVAFGALGVLALRPHVRASPVSTAAPPLAEVLPAPPSFDATLEAAPTGAGPSAIRRPPAPSAAPATSVPAAPPIVAAPSAGCSELLQRASLDTLSPAEAARLKKECRS